MRVRTDAAVEVYHLITVCHSPDVRGGVHRGVTLTGDCLHSIKKTLHYITDF